jgi:hypothetical protein
VTPLQSDFPAAGARLVPGAASLVGSGLSWLPGVGRAAKFRRLLRGPATRNVAGSESESGDVRYALSPVPSTRIARRRCSARNSLALSKGPALPHGRTQMI